MKPAERMTGVQSPAATDEAVAEATLVGARNQFNRFEWAGAFGDLGTLIPFIVGYVSVVGMDPCGVLFAFGFVMIVSGSYYDTPFPVQPMKAIGAVATAQAGNAAITANAVGAAGLITGALWLLLGASGFAKRLSSWVSNSVVAGIVLGLGLSLMLVAIRMMADGWLLAGAALGGTLLLLTRPTIPAMLLLLGFGAVIALFQDPALARELRASEPELRLPGFSLGSVSWVDLATGTLLLALPQVPLTFGNAVIAITRENNRLFPDRPVNERKVMLSTGIMNLVSAALGGVPMCHGAGGMAGHVRFGARTGGAMIILGSILLVLAIFFSGSIQTLFRMFPTPILGVILLLAGEQLAWGPGSTLVRTHRTDRVVILATAALALWNVGVAFVVGLVFDYVVRHWSPGSGDARQ
ncbi:MAG TPA: putative sulfate/molybdate transporter [Candidatus Methylomirabilis sp.]|nr:putative sulfate/molybdate transporter [Candidatus Methylomirabilis sp.]